MFSSCIKKETNLHNTLSSAKGTFWLMFISQESKAYRAYEFFDNGTCTYYLLDRHGQWNKYNGGDDQVSNTWRVQHDTLVINGSSNCIISCDHNQISLVTEKDTFIFRRRNN
jgi:hypothetical protein